MHAELERIQAENPGLSFEEAYDNSYLVNIILDSTFQELLISVLLAGIVILVFLKDFRATAIIMISIPTSLALYGFTTDWGATLPLTLASGLLGTASIVAMTSYAFSRADTARNMNKEAGTSLQFGISPLSGGALATVVLKF